MHHFKIFKSKNVPWGRVSVDIIVWKMWFGCIIASRVSGGKRCILKRVAGFNKASGNINSEEKKLESFENVCEYFACILIPKFSKYSNI